MRKRTGAFLLVFGVVLLVVGALMAATGSGDEVGIALLGMIPFGVGSVAAGATAFLSRGSESVRVGHVSGRRSGPAVVFPLSVAKLRLAFVGQICFALLGLSLFLYADEFADPGESATYPAAIGLFCVVLMGLFAILTLPSVLGPAGWVALRPEGLETKGGRFTAFVPWSAIEGLGERAVRGNRFLEVHALHSSAVEMNTLGRAVQALGRSMGYDADFSVAATTLRADLDTVAAAIEHVLAHPEQRDRLGTPESLVDLGLEEATVERPSRRVSAAEVRRSRY